MIRWLLRRCWLFVSLFPVPSSEYELMLDDGRLCMPSRHRSVLQLQVHSRLRRQYGDCKQVNYVNSKVYNHLIPIYAMSRKELINSSYVGIFL